MKSLAERYSQRYRFGLVPVANTLERFLRDHLKRVGRIDRTTVRPKSLERFLKKADKEENGKRKYSDPFNQINDQIGGRIVTYYLSDIDRIATNVLEICHPIEHQDLVPESASEFGYEGKHLVLLLPTDVLDDGTEQYAPKWFELQIKTLFQHAWAEAEHDLGYKTDVELTRDQKRMLAFTAAQAWGADKIFNDLFTSVSGSR
jgi:putative GTP pyrophosphokinase